MSHCPTCSCEEAGGDTRIWVPYDPADDKRESDQHGRCSACKQFALIQYPQDAITLRYASGAQRFYCRDCAVIAGFTGQLTSTMAARTLQLRALLECGAIDPEEFSAQLDALS